MDTIKHRSCQSHCCILHGCKYGHDDCPVVIGELLQLYCCEDCSEEGITRCTNCGSLMTKWFANTSFTGGIPDGRYRSGDATSVLYRGCLTCSETLDHADTQEFLDEHINVDWEAVQSKADLKAIEVQNETSTS